MFYKFSRLAVLLVLSGLIVFFACRKNDLSSSSGSPNDEAITDPGVSLDVTLAKKYFKILKNEKGAEVKSPHVSSLSKTERNFKHPYWQRVFTGVTAKSSFVEVPLFYDRRPTVIVTKENEQLDKAARLKVLNASFDRLLIYKDKKTGLVDQRIITYVPDVDYLDKRGKDISQNRFGHLDAAFKGYLVYRKWDGTLSSMVRINNGVAEKHLNGFKRQQTNTRTNAGAKTEAVVCTTQCITEYTQNCYTSTSGEYTYTWCDDYSPGSTYCWEECHDDGGGDTGDPCIDYGDCGGSGGGGGGSSWPSTLILNLPDPGKVIPNMTDYLHCFNVNGNAIVNIYVDQPTENSSETWSGNAWDPNVGHTFVSIEQNGVSRVFGFYPSDGVNPYTDPTANSALIDDSGHPYDVKITIAVTGSQLAAAINYATHANGTYNLNTYNCTDFGIGMAAAVGVTLPDNNGTWPGGGGSNPGNLGQDIRSWTAPGNVVKKTTAGTSISNTGTCP